MRNLHLCFEHNAFICMHTKIAIKYYISLHSQFNINAEFYLLEISVINRISFRKGGKVNLNTSSSLNTHYLKYKIYPNL